MNKIIKIGLAIFGVAILLFVCFLFSDKEAENNTDKLGAYSSEVVFLNATTTTATSTNQFSPTIIESAEKITFFFQRGDTTGQGNTGTSTFSVQIAQKNDSESDWITYNRLIDNVTNTNSQTLTRVGSVILSASGDYGTATATKAYSMDLSQDVYKYARCVVNEGTDGEHTCKAIIKYK